MFQIEIYEYHPKMKDIYLLFLNIFGERVSPNQSSNLTNNSNIIDTYNNSHHIGDNIENKIMKIQTLSHPFIAKYMDFIKDDCNYIFVSENQGDSLDSIIDLKMSENASFKLDEVTRLLYSVLLALNYLEKKGIVTRFLDTKRILVDEDSSIKLRNYIVDVLFIPEEMKFIKYNNS
jgi:serine/threonine protein kinase